jgi:plastocyanin
MHFTSIITAIGLLAVPAFAKIIPVTVGLNSTLTFSPNNIVADVGDLVLFTFYPKNHSVVQANFATPCQPKAEGFNSGFDFATTSGESENEFVVKVEDTTPIWFYCAQANHCEQGMVGVINEVAGS